MNDNINTYQPPVSVMTAPDETATSALATQARSMIEARYLMAINRPRDLDMVRERLLKECRRPSFAEVARYRKPIGKGVEGPSIRFAEAAIRCMANITVETMTVFDNVEKRIVRVMVTDLEANVPYSQDVTITKTIERLSLKTGEVPLKTRINSKGQTLYILEATDDDILNKQGALISKAVRTLGLRLIPGDLLDEAMDEVLRTLNTRDAQDPDAAKRRLFDSFSGLGVSAEQIKDFLGHKGDVLSPKELADLRALYSAIRDGETTWREVMESRAPQDEKRPASKPSKGGLKDALKAVSQAQSPAAPPEPEQDAAASGSPEGLALD
jgi:hypothetical protein